jgi:serine/threonine protein kinase/WD40 repeat protein
MDQRQVVPPCAEELQAYAQGKCERQRAVEIEAFLADGHDCAAILEAAPEDAVLRHLRGAGDMPWMEGPPGRNTVTLLPHAESAEGAPSPPGYEIVGELGRGGMGVVYQARQVALNRLVALKMILAGGHANEAGKARFRTEAEAVARLQHPNIVQIHEVGEHQGLPFFSLEFCAGGSLAKQLNGTPLPARKAAALVESLARSIQAAHGQQIIHRDLSPANVLLAADGMPKITDFGLAKMLDGAAQTQSGAVMGTPSYMAPEQAAGKGNAIGPTADVYALGAILYECLTGRPPFKAATALDTIHQVVHDEPVPVRQLQSQTPRDLETICLKCLQKDPQKRYATALALAEELGRVQRGEPITARPVGRWERGWRWCRRNPAVAALSAVAAVLLLAASVVSVVFAFEQEKAARNLKTEKDRAETALKQSRSNEALLLGDRAIRICEEGEDGQASDPYRGLLWLARAVELAPADDEQLQHLLRCNWAAWQTQLCPLLGTLSVPQTGNPVNFAVWSPDGREVVVGGDQGLEIWDVRAWRRGPTLPFQDKTVAVAWSPDGRWIASGGIRGVPVRIWNRNERTVQEWQTLARVLDLNFSHDSEQLAAACNDGAIHFWSVRSAKPLGSPLPLSAEEPATSVAFSPDGSRFVTTTRSTLQQWNARNRTALGAPWDAPEESHWHCARYAVNSERLSVAVLPSARGNCALVLATETAKVETQIPGMGRSVHLSPNGKHFVVGLNACRGEVGVFARPDKRFTITGHQSEVVAAAFAPDGGAVLTASKDGTVRLSALPADLFLPPFVLPFRGPRQTLAPRKLPQYTTADGVRCLAVSPDGQLLFAGGWDRSGLLVDAADGSVAGEIPEHEDVITAAAFLPDGKRLLTGTADQKVRLWDVGTRRLLHEPWRCPAAIRYFAISPDGSLVVIGQMANGPRGGGPFPAQLLQLGHLGNAKMEGLTGPLWRGGPGTTFLPNGKELLVGTLNGVDLWDVAKRQATALPLYHTSFVSALAVDAVGKWAATGAWCVGQIWDLESGIPIGPPLRHKERFKTVAFSPDGRLVASLAYDGDARFWDAATGRAIGPLLKHPGAGNALVFHPMGDVLLTSSNGRRVHRRRVPRPVTEESSLLMLRTQVLTGMELDAEGVVRLLSADTWRERRQQLEQLAPDTVPCYNPKDSRTKP